MDVTDQGKIAAALALMNRVHAGQTDKAGVDYRVHILTVTVNVAAIVDDWRYIVVALLHDLLEDCERSERAALREEIRLTFGEQILGAVDAMTHRDGETYAEYIERIAVHPIARVVKIVDLRHNLDVTRLKVKVHPKADMYGQALARLHQV